MNHQVKQLFCFRLKPHRLFFFCAHAGSRSFECAEKNIGGKKGIFNPSAQKIVGLKLVTRILNLESHFASSPICPDLTEKQ